MLIGEVIKKYREEHNLSQREFAKRTKLSASYINTLEKLYNPKNGKPYFVTVDVTDQLAKAMHITLNELLEKCDYKPIQDEYNLLIEGNIQYAKIYFKDKNYTIEQQIDELEKNIDILERHISSCKATLDTLKDWETDRITDNKMEIERKRKEIQGLTKIIEQLKK